MIWLLSVAFAGSGPWTIPSGSTNLYLGLDQVRYDQVVTPSGRRDLDGGISAVAAVGVFTVGVLDGVELEVVAPWVRSRHANPDGELCTGASRPDDWCDVTSSLGNVRFGIKGLVLDEAALHPVSIALGAHVRSGEAYSQTRGRLTALGEGQTDLGASASIGRTGGAMKAGWYQAGATVRYWHRLPLTTTPRKVPADELDADLTAVISPVARLGMGPLVSMFYRLGGDNLGQDLDLTDPNGFAALAAAQLKVGGQIAVYGDRGLTVTAGAAATVWARNNPSDTLVLSVGLGWYRDRSPEPPPAS